jgi:hypothetical protein
LDQEFPDITICNTYPLNNIDLDIWKTYLANLASAQQTWTCDEIRKKLDLDMSDEYCNYTWWQLSLPPALFATLPPFDDGVGDKNLIANCQFYNWDWSQSDIDCSSNTKLVWDESYYKCYKIQVPKVQSQVIICIRTLCCFCLIQGAFSFLLGYLLSVEKYW